MKKERKIQLVTDDFIEPPGEELTGEQAEIDALLRAVADDCSAKIDFEGIKQRAVESAKAKKAKRGRLRRAIGYGMVAAASLVVGLFVWQAVKGMNERVPNGDAVDAQAAERNDDGLTKHDPIADVKVYVGTVSEAEYTAFPETADEFFPENLPETMKKRVDTDAVRTSATGTDTKGGSLDYVCTVEKGCAKGLEVGEACSEKTGEDLWYYWQINENHYLKVRFTGFDQEDAEAMFKSLADRITMQEKNR